MVYPGMVLYSSTSLPTGVVVAFRVKAMYRPSANACDSIWLVDVMRVETRGRDKVSVTEDAVFEFELERMRLAP